MDTFITINTNATAMRTSQRTLLQNPINNIQEHCTEYNNTLNNTGGSPVELQLHHLELPQQSSTTWPIPVTKYPHHQPLRTISSIIYNHLNGRLYHHQSLTKRQLHSLHQLLRTLSPIIFTLPPMSINSNIPTIYIATAITSNHLTAYLLYNHLTNHIQTTDQSYTSIYSITNILLIYSMKLSH